MTTSPSQRRNIGHGVLDALGGLPLFLTAPLGRCWHQRWGAAGAEVRAAMPGDEVVPRASFTATRAITIAAPPDMVWPWIVQTGPRLRLTWDASGPEVITWRNEMAVGNGSWFLVEEHVMTPAQQTGGDPRRGL